MNEFSSLALKFRNIYKLCVLTKRFSYVKQMDENDSKSRKPKLWCKLKALQVFLSPSNIPWLPTFQPLLRSTHFTTTPGISR